MSWGHVDGKDKRVYLEKINVPQDAIIKLYGFPAALPAAMMVGDADNRIIGYSNDDIFLIKGSDFMERGKLRQIRDEIEENHRGAEIVLVDNIAGLGMNKVMQLVRDNMYCRALRFNLTKSIICVPNDLKDSILEEN